MDFEPDTIDVKGLGMLLKAIKGVAVPKARVGILGDKNQRKDGDPLTNSEIGAIHEYGSPAQGISQRSFLRMPLFTRLEKDMGKAGAFKEEELKAVIKKGTVFPWLKKITVMAEGIVRESFDSQGYGTWPDWKNPKYTNNTGKVLLDTQQLRESITSECKEK